MLPLAHEFVGSLCEIKNMENHLLAIARIIKIDHDALEFTSPDDDRMMLIEYRLPVKIMVHNNKYGSPVLVGSSYLSTENFIRLEDVRPIQNFERRGAFRVNINVDGKLFPVQPEQHQQAFIENSAPVENFKDTSTEPVSHTVTVLDASLTGIRFYSPTHFKPGDKFFIEFSPLDIPMEFCLNICRLIHTSSGKIHYGCQFVDYSERQLDMLCRDLFQIQRIEKNRRRNII